MVSCEEESLSPCGGKEEPFHNRSKTRQAVTKPLLLLFLFPLLLWSPCVFGGSKVPDRGAPYLAKVWKGKKGAALNYRFRAPDEVAKGEKYPLFVFYHGAGGRGADNFGQIRDAGAIKAFAEAGLFSDRPCYLLAGQVPKGKLWVDVAWSSLEHEMPKISDSMRLMFEVIDAHMANGNLQIDPDRVYAMGLSMGGYGTWDAIQRRPGLFAAAVPICGGGDKSRVRNIASLPIWAWHGDRDKVIRISRSTDMIAAIKAAGGAPRFTELKGVGHNAWSDCWKSREMWDWLFAQKRRPD